MGQGDEAPRGHGYEFSSQLFELCREHSLNQANLQ